MFGLFSKKSDLLLGCHTDFHNHLLPGIDDGVSSFDEALAILKVYGSWGIKNVITTPHIISDSYNNTPEIILDKCEMLRQKIVENNININITAAAEYYIDEDFRLKVLNNEPLLTFGKKHILVETSYVDLPPFFDEVIFELKIRGYQPIYAHPERYHFAMQNYSVLKQLYEKGIYFQINIMSLAGHYDKDVKQLAHKLIADNMVDFVGTDCHGMRHIPVLQKALGSDYYKRLLAKNLIMNDKL
ncbi:MAG: CpsB/CapC family capsule biosynthesis tyrosine phosphatase [Cytophagales bacterium]|nr:CpsB/CapC family capsule biosynthesis tyrosine phosphatase [Cytophagales bacterium]